MKAEWPKQRSVLILLWIAVGLVIVLARFTDIRTYPLPGPDEGIWHVEAKDAVLFCDRSMSQFPQAFVSPFHFALTWLVFHMLPATFFSMRFVSAGMGLASLLLLAFIVARRYGSRSALAGVALVGLSFVMITINRRAYLESGVILFSLLALDAATRKSSWRYLAMGIGAALLVFYKSNAVYILATLLVPPPGPGAIRDAGRRLFVLCLGVGAAALGLFLVARISPVESGAAYNFEFTKGLNDVAWIRIGRFGLYPCVLRDSFRVLFSGYTDLMLMIAIGVGAFILGRGWRDRLALRMVLWLVAGFGFLCSQAFQHAQYFAPFIVPAGLLVVAMGSHVQARWGRRLLWTMAALVVGLSLARVGVGWQRARLHNPSLEALGWLESQPLEADEAFLAGPDVVLGTERKGYMFNRIFHPLPPSEAPDLAQFLKTKRIRYVVFDEWETAPFFNNEPEFAALLNRFPQMASGSGWVAYEVTDEVLTQLGVRNL